MRCQKCVAFDKPHYTVIIIISKTKAANIISIIKSLVNIFISPDTQYINGKYIFTLYKVEHQPFN